MPPPDARTLVGVIADTHGLLRPEALAALAGCDRILHAGDLGKPGILERLSRVAPTVAVRGNVDRGLWAEALPETLSLSIRGAVVHVLHDLHDLPFDPGDRKIDVVISGHSHQPSIREKAGVIYLNPGSAGPRRFSLPVTLALLAIGPEAIRVDLIDVLGGTPLQTLSTRRVSVVPGPGA